MSAVCTHRRGPDSNSNSGPPLLQCAVKIDVLNIAFALQTHRCFAFENFTVPIITLLKTHSAVCCGNRFVEHKFALQTHKFKLFKFI